MLLAFIYIIINSKISRFVPSCKLGTKGKNAQIQTSKILLCVRNNLESFPMFQEDLNRGKPNWEHLSDELHVLLTVEDTENRAHIKLERAEEEVKKLLVPVSIFPQEIL